MGTGSDGHDRRECVCDGLFIKFLSAPWNLLPPVHLQYLKLSAYRHNSTNCYVVVGKTKYQENKEKYHHWLLIECF